MSISKTEALNLLTKALDKQDEYNEVKYATKAEAAKLFKLKGSVQTADNLPLTNNQPGDVYNILNVYSDTTVTTDMNGTTIKAGDNVVYVDDGAGNAGWDVLGGTTDLSSYYTKTQIDAMEETISDNEIYQAVADANPDIQLGTQG